MVSEPEHSRAAAARTLGVWLMARGQGDQHAVTSLSATAVDSAWLFNGSGAGYGRAEWLVSGDEVMPYLRAHLSLDEALLMLDDPRRRRTDGTVRSYRSAALSYNWAAREPVIAVPVVRERLTGAYIFHGLGDEDDAAGVLRRRNRDAEGVGRCWSEELARMFREGTSAADAVGSLRGRRGAGGDGDVGADLHRFDGGKQELRDLLDPELAATAGPAAVRDEDPKETDRA